MTSQLEAILKLSGDEFRDAVLAQAGNLVWGLRDAPDEAKARLAEVVRDAWPAEGVAASVKREPGKLHFANQGAHAWITLGPAVDVEPTVEQWADIATSGAVLTDTATWLGRHYTEDAAVLAASTCESTAVRPWADLTSAIPRDVRTPEVVVEALLKHAVELESPETPFELWQLGDRFAREQRLDALEALSARDGMFERHLRPWRAQLGDVRAAELLLEEMRAALADGASSERLDDTPWLEGLTDPSLLPPLFATLDAAIRAEGESPFGVSGAIQRAIHRIGGDDAVRMYDELIESSDESRFKFLRFRRDEIVQSELRAVGQEGAADVASQLGVPVLDDGT